MEFYYTDPKGVEHGPHTEREMADWFRLGYFYEETKIRFNRNGKEFNTTIERMRKKNGSSTPFIFAVCEREEKEKKLRKEVEDALKSVNELELKMRDVKKSVVNTSTASKQLMDRMQKMLEKREAEKPRFDQSDDQPSTSAAAVAPAAQSEKDAAKRKNEPRSKTGERRLPLLYIDPEWDRGASELEEGSIEIRELRSILDTIDCNQAQKALNLPVTEKCRVCGLAGSIDTVLIRPWICHITSKNHIAKYRERGGRVTQRSLDWYRDALQPFVLQPVQLQQEGVAELEKKKVDLYGGIVLPPAYIPLMHIDPSDTTRMPERKELHELAKLRDLVFGHTDRFGSAGLHKLYYSSIAYCELCPDAPKFAGGRGSNLLGHMLSKDHVTRYRAARGGYSQRDFDFWTELCLLVPEIGKDTRDVQMIRKEVRENARILDLSKCEGSLHYTIYGGEERRKHLVDFITKQLDEHCRPVVVYVAEVAQQELQLYLKNELPSRKIGWIPLAAARTDEEVLLSDALVRLQQPHAVAFLTPPSDLRSAAEYAQRMSADFVKANLIVAVGPVESRALLNFSNRSTNIPSSVITPAAAAAAAAAPAPAATAAENAATAAPFAAESVKPPTVQQAQPKPAPRPVPVASVAPQSAMPSTPPPPLPRSQTVPQPTPRVTATAQSGIRLPDVALTANEAYSYHQSQLASKAKKDSEKSSCVVM